MRKNCCAIDWSYARNTRIDLVYEWNWVRRPLCWNMLIWTGFRTTNKPSDGEEVLSGNVLIWYIVSFIWKLFRKKALNLNKSNQRLILSDAPRALGGILGNIFILHCRSSVGYLFPFQTWRRVICLRHLNLKQKVTDRSRDFWKVTAVTYPFGAALNQLWMAPGSSYTHRVPPSPYFVATYLHNSVLLRIPEIRELEPVKSIVAKQLWSNLFLFVLELDFYPFLHTVKIFSHFLRGGLTIFKKIFIRIFRTH